MAYTVNINGIMQIVFEARLNGQQIMNTFHYELVAPSSIPDGAATLVGMLSVLSGADNMFQKWLDCMSVDVIDAQIWGQWIKPTRYVRIDGTPPAETGTIAEDAATQNVAAVITRRGEQAIRHAIGSVHIGGVPTLAIEGGMISAVHFTRLNNFATQMRAGRVIGGAELSPTVYQRGNYLNSQNITQTIVQDEARVMRRRTVGRGT